jgi:hypothetical protein
METRYESGFPPSRSSPPLPTKSAQIRPILPRTTPQLPRSSADHIYIESPLGDLVELTRDEAEQLRDALDALNATRGLGAIVHGLNTRVAAEEPRTDEERRASCAPNPGRPRNCERDRSHTDPAEHSGADQGFFSPCVFAAGLPKPTGLADTVRSHRACLERFPVSRLPPSECRPDRRVPSWLRDRQRARRPRPVDSAGAIAVVRRESSVSYAGAVSPAGTTGGGVPG